MRSIQFILLVYAIVSCKETIEWRLPETSPKLVVQGEVTNEYKQHYIALTRSQGYYDQNEPTPVSGATIHISDGETIYQMVELYPDYFPGLYLSEVEFSGIVGRTYQLTITLSEVLDGNSTYTSEMRMRSVFEISSLHYKLHNPPETSIFNYESRVYFSVAMQNESPGEGDFYFLKVIKNGTLLTDGLEKCLVWDDRWFEGKTEVQTGDFGFFEPINSKDTLVLEVQSINQDYYDFVNNVKLELAAKDPFGFVGSPANIEGNISHGALGYFLCTAIERDTVVVE
jgi:hypothetical protein